MIRLVCSVLASLLLASTVLAKTVKLQWDPYPDVGRIEGFELHYRPFGVPQYDFKNPIVKNISKTATTVTVEIPEDGFLVLRAYAKSGRRSENSNEVSTAVTNVGEPGKDDRPKIPPRSAPGTGAGGKIPPTRTIR